MPKEEAYRTQRNSDITGFYLGCCQGLESEPAVSNYSAYDLRNICEAECPTQAPTEVCVKKPQPSSEQSATQFSLSSDGADSGILSSDGADSGIQKSEQVEQGKRGVAVLSWMGLLIVGALVVFSGYWVGRSVGENKSSAADAAADTTYTQTFEPTGAPIETPTASISTKTPSLRPTKMPVGESMGTTTSPATIRVTYVPGNLTFAENGLLLSTGLRARIIATSGEAVVYHDGSNSTKPFHGRPDFGATFPDTRPNNLGGWVYTSNSEMNVTGAGGVGAITFDKDGNLIDYRMVLENTTMNCGGGRSPWGTWVSCEEIEFVGEIYQVDPFGERPAEKMTIGSEFGRWESFAYDVRDPQDPRFFATEDHNKGTVRRFRPDPSSIDWDSPWDMLHANGVIDYLIVHPDNSTFEWINDIKTAKNNARSYYPQSEGIDIYGSQMYVVCKKIKKMFVFNLDDMTYYNRSTVTGLFDGGPDQMARILDGVERDLLYFTEEGGKDAGIHARDELGRFYTIFESPVYLDETTGLSFSPDAKHMYVAYQDNGLLFDIWRDDGLPFGARTLNVKYHHQE